MKVMHLTWEFPPNKVGGIASVLENLTKSQLKCGVTPIVVTCAFEGKEGYENYEGVHVYRFNADNIPAEDFPSWALEMNLLMQRVASDVINKEGGVDLIHAHDWLVAMPAISLKHLYRIPLISTIHALESGRYGGINGDRQEFIHSLEGRLVFESWKVICNSEFMKNSVLNAFHVPWDQVSVIPNGVSIESMEAPSNISDIRNNFAMSNEKIITYVGRHVFEKGVDVLVGAVPSVLSKHPEVKFVICGTGYMRDRCKNIANELGVSDKVIFPDFIDDNTRNALLHMSSVFVVPSRYEPFGITPLEAMACNTPVVVSDTGGLSEIVEHEKDGIKVYPDNSKSLAWGINRVLEDDNLSNYLVQNAKKKIDELYNWDKIALNVQIVYDIIHKEYTDLNWKPVVSFIEK
ncbi:MAG: glycosyltransferase family 4 protein [DPANN group archaeon]|nr:glycosyltransferase family 4 protein [DPANN group archaeon]